MVAFTFTLSTQQADAGVSLSSRPARAVERAPISKQIAAAAAAAITKCYENLYTVKGLGGLKTFSFRDLVTDN